MSWAIGYDANWKRDIGYGVPAICDHPDCNERIDRGLSYVCGDEPYGGDKGCGLYFCDKHQRGRYQRCWKCARYAKTTFSPKPDVARWIHHKLHDESWGRWRAECPEQVAELRARLDAIAAEVLQPGTKCRHIDTDSEVEITSVNKWLVRFEGIEVEGDVRYDMALSVLEAA